MADPPSLSGRRRLKQAGVRVLSLITPWIYLAYMRLVRLTSRVDTGALREVFERRDRGEPTCLVLLHQDCVFGPYFVGGDNHATVASVGDAGDIISATLRRMGFTVFRGGSSTRDSRRTPVVRDVIRFAKRPGTPGAIVSMVPDGSNGPAGALKPGFALVALRTGAPVYCAKLYMRRALYLNTWDRTAVPLPFNDIRIDVGGPFTIAPGTRSAEFEAYRRQVESAMHALHNHAFECDGRRPIPPMTKYAAAGSD